MSSLLLCLFAVWTPFVASGREMFFDSVSGNVVTVDDGLVTPVRVLAVFSDAGSASSSLSSGVASYSLTRQVGYTSDLIAVVGVGHHSRVQVEAAWWTAAWVSAGVVSCLAAQGVVFGYWMSNQRTGKL